MYGTATLLAEFFGYSEIIRSYVGSGSAFQRIKIVSGTYGPAITGSSVPPPRRNAAEFINVRRRCTC